jgi:hypothetical protein
MEQTTGHGLTVFCRRDCPRFPTTPGDEAFFSKSVTKTAEPW